MELQPALEQSPYSIACLQLAEGELLTTSSHRYHRFTTFSSTADGSAQVYRCQINSEDFDETRVYADHRFIDTRAPESILWEPVGEKLENVPGWAQTMVRNTLFPAEA